MRFPDGGHHGGRDDLGDGGAPPGVGPDGVSGGAGGWQGAQAHVRPTGRHLRHNRQCAPIQGIDSVL